MTRPQTVRKRCCGCLPMHCSTAWTSARGEFDDVDTRQLVGWDGMLCEWEQMQMRVVEAHLWPAAPGASGVDTRPPCSWPHPTTDTRPLAEGLERAFWIWSACKTAESEWPAGVAVAAGRTSTASPSSNTKGDGQTKHQFQIYYVVRWVLRCDV